MENNYKSALQTKKLYYVEPNTKKETLFIPICSVSIFSISCLVLPGFLLLFNMADSLIISDPWPSVSKLPFSSTRFNGTMFVSGNNPWEIKFFITF